MAKENQLGTIRHYDQLLAVFACGTVTSFLTAGQTATERKATRMIPIRKCSIGNAASLRNVRWPTGLCGKQTSKGMDAGSVIAPTTLFGHHF